MRVKQSVPSPHPVRDEEIIEAVTHSRRKPTVGRIMRKLGVEFQNHLVRARVREVISNNQGHLRLEQIGQYSIEDVLSPVRAFREQRSRIAQLEANFGGQLVKMGSQRYQVFARSLTCVSCGLQGQYFVLERHHTATRYHFNLYGVNHHGIEVLFTKDHIIPVSKGGTNLLGNYQTMCSPCNAKKANR